MKVPDAIEPAVGYRVWVVRAGGELFSVNHGEFWTPGQVFEATCHRGGSHEVPDVNCSCGAYAAATFNRLFDMGYTKSEGLFASPEPTVAGQVSMWGGIVPGTVGWRAQFAYPKLLLVPYSRWRMAKEIADKYKVPYKLYNLERKH